jgi:hypothetical protein
MRQLDAGIAGTIALVLPPFLAAQVPMQQRNHSEVAPECATAVYRQFDFWLGEWEVQFADGTPAGSNRIERILGGCALHERWTSARPPYTGESFNTYRQDTGTWHQTWIDNAGSVLLLEGRWENGRMVLEGAGTDSSGTRVLNRITWSRLDNSGERVRQHWETSRDGREWHSEFDGIYIRKR